MANTTYAWHAPWMHESGMAGPTPPRLQIRGLMNTGTNFLGAVLDKARVKLAVAEERKHMLPWVLHKRGKAAVESRLDIIMIRHPISWITGMKKAPYFLDCGGRDPMEDPEAPCKLHLMWKSSSSSPSKGKVVKERVDVQFTSIVDIWNRYYAAYLRWPGRWAIVRYEDLLLDADRSLEVLLATVTLEHERRGSAVALRPAKTHGKSRSYGDARRFNLDKRWRLMFRDGVVANHCANANASLLRRFHYTCP